MTKRNLFLISFGVFLFLLIVVFVIKTKNTPQQPPKPEGFWDFLGGLGIIKKEQVYANFDGVKVYNNDLSVYKTAKKDEWVGTIEEGKSYVDEGYYHLNGGKKVYANSTYIK